MTQISELSTFLVPGRKHSFTAKEEAVPSVVFRMCGTISNEPKFAGTVSNEPKFGGAISNEPKFGGEISSVECD